MSYLFARCRGSFRKLLFSLAVSVAWFACASEREQEPAEAKAPAVDIGEIVSALDDEIWHVFQAKNKDYWFGSHVNGAYRYDGKTLVRYSTKDGLPSNGISGFQEDEAGNIYITSDGISRFDGKSFTNLTVEPGSDPDNWVLGKNDLWFAGPKNSGGVYRFDGKSLHFLKFPATAAGDRHYEEVPRAIYTNAKYSPYDPFCVFRDRNGNIWFGSAILGACRFDGKTHTWLGDEHLRNGSFGTRSIVEDKDGKFWFSNALNRYSVDLKDPAAPSFTKEVGLRNPDAPEKVPFGGIMSAVSDETGNLWIATYGEGVWRYDGTDLKHFPVEVGGQPIHLYTITRDRQGTLWLGTQTNGAWRFNGTAFERFLAGP